MAKREISVYRNDKGTVCFHYPKEWSGEKVFEEICELCADLQKDLNWYKRIAKIRSGIMQEYKNKIDELLKEKENVSIK